MLTWVSDSDEVVITVDVKEVACSFQFPGRGKLWSVVASDAHGATLVSLLTIVHDVLAVVRSFFLLSPYPIFLIQD